MTLRWKRRVVRWSAQVPRFSAYSVLIPPSALHNIIPAVRRSDVAIGWPSTWARNTVVPLPLTAVLSPCVPCFCRRGWGYSRIGPGAVHDSQKGANLPIEIAKWPDAQRTSMLARSGKSLAGQGGKPQGERVRKWLEWLEWDGEWLPLPRARPNEKRTPGCSGLLFRLEFFLEGSLHAFLLWQMGIITTGG